MKFEDIVKQYGKPLHELNDSEVNEIITKLDAAGLEKFEAAVKSQPKTSKPRKVSQATQEALDNFDKILLNTTKPCL